jgi:hypothetical protein
MMGKRTILSVVAMAVAVLTVGVGTATATTLTSPLGTVYTGMVKAEAEEAITLHNSSIGASVSCKNSALEGKVESHGSGVTAKGNLSSLSFSGCGEDLVTVLNNGFLEVHEKQGGGDGTLTSTGAEVTVTEDSTGISCLYKTSETDVGTLAGSTTTGKTATLDLDSSLIPRTGDSFFCGSSGVLTGSYAVTTPDVLATEKPSGLTAPTNKFYTGSVKGNATVAFHNPSLGATWSCKDSTFEGNVAQHGTGVTTRIALASTTFTSCSGLPITVINPGSLEVHATSEGNGTVTSSETVITMTTTGLGVSCTYRTMGTHIGTLSGSSSSNAYLVIGATLPRTGDSIYCGSRAQWTARYDITTPSTLLVD